MYDSNDKITVSITTMIITPFSSYPSFYLPKINLSPKNNKFVASVFAFVCFNKKHKKYKNTKYKYKYN